MKHVSVAGLTIGNDCPLTVIAGPCQIESLDQGHEIAGRLQEACNAAGAQYVFKASYDKANRTSVRTGTPNVSLIDCKACNPASIPIPR